MKRALILAGMLWLSLQACLGQLQPMATIRLSALLFPFTPLLSVECRMLYNLAIQGETNFLHTHGLNLKYYLRSPLERGYLFVGSAFVQNRLLRQGGGSTTLPYAGWGYAYVFDPN